MQPNERLTLAIQKKGRLSDDSIALLQDSCLQFYPSNSPLYCSCESFPLDIVFVRDDDIPSLIKERACDLGIVGENVLYEYADDSHYEILKQLSFGRCRLSIATPSAFIYHDISSLEGKRIATSYPNLLQQFLNINNINAKIITVSGSVEIAPMLGLSDVVCDLVSTGKTLAENNLSEKMVLLESQAVLVKAKGKFNPIKNKLIETLLGNFSSNKSEKKAI